MPACKKPCCCVSPGAQSRQTSTAPGSSRDSSAPRVCIAPWRAKLSRTRRAKSLLAGSRRGTVKASLTNYVYVNVNYEAFFPSRCFGVPSFSVQKLAVRKPSTGAGVVLVRSEEHTSEFQSLRHLVCRLLLEKKNKHKLAAHTSRRWTHRLTCRPQR